MSLVFGFWFLVFGFLVFWLFWLSWLSLVIFGYLGYLGLYLKKVDFQVILTIFWPKWAKKDPNGDENLKILSNRVHIRIQNPKVSIKRYIIWHIEKVGFRPRKWLSVKIWPLKIFFASKQVKIDFFHFIFANWVIWNKK